MAKLTLTDLSSFNPTSAMATINSNNSAIEAALELTLTRTGTAPNAMEADLDMNDNDILNLPEATAPTNPVRLQEFNELEEHVDDLEDDVSNALAQFQAAMSAIVILEGDLTAAVAAAQAAQAGAEASAAAALVSQLAAQLAEAQAEAAAAQTAIDALTASDAAAAALVSENNAETAETNAEAAEAAAELAQQASEDAQAAAEAAALDAAQSAAEAENAADNFDDVYLGSKPSDPSVDNDGDPLVEGQLYWNNVSNTLRIYDGSAWQSYTAATGMLDLVDDTSPQLGGTLDPNGFAITGYSTKTQADALYQSLDSDLTAIAALTPSNDHIIQRKSGAWINRSIAQLLVDLAVPGTTFQPLDADLTAWAAVNPSQYSTKAVADTLYQPLDADLTAWAAVNPSAYLNTAGIAAAYQPLDSDLTAIAALSTASYGRGLLTQASAAATQSYLGVRTVLLANLSLYVNDSTGSDSNDGSIGAPFKTIQKAIDTVAALDISIYDVTISVADGTYTAGGKVNGSWIGSGTVSVVGNNTTPANVLINPPGGTCMLAQNGGRISVTGMEFRGNVGLWSSVFGSITTTGPMRFSSIIYQLYANGGKIVISTNYTICGSALAHITVDTGGALVASSLTITFESSPAWAGAFLNVSGTGSVVIYYLNTFVHPTVTMTIASPGVITYTGHNMLANAPLAFATTGALPTGIVAGTTYFVKTVLSANTFTVSGTAGGAAINTTGSQSGVHTIISTGSKYAVSQLGQISVNGAGINYPPGNAPGTGTNPGVSPYGLYL